MTKPELGVAEHADTPAPPRAAPWPWYRREPWLSVALAAFVPVGIGFAVPPHLHDLLLAVSGLLLVVSMAMLIRQGPFRAHPRPETGGQPVGAVRAPRG